MIDRGHLDIRRQVVYAVQPFMGQKVFKSMWFRAWWVGLSFAIWTMSYAQDAIDFENTLGAIPESICNAALFLQGPVGFAVVAIIFFIGLIRILAGNRGGLGFIITAFVVGLVLLAAPEILAVFTEDGCV
jgi:TRAP-type C4-dicarboxylate transport system permease small subunit